jgi:hypothetical protein
MYTHYGRMYSFKTTFCSYGLSHHFLRHWLQAVAAAGNLYAACLFERLPLVAPEDPGWQIEYEEWTSSRRERRSKTVSKEWIDEKQTGEPGPGTT